MTRRKLIEDASKRAALICKIAACEPGPTVPYSYIAADLGYIEQRYRDIGWTRDRAIAIALDAYWLTYHSHYESTQERDAAAAQLIENGELP